MSITRAQFFALTKLDVDTHTALKRRDLMPVNNAATRTYTPFEAYTYLLAERFAERRAGDRIGSCAIVRDSLRNLIACAPEIVTSGETYRLSDEHEPIYVARLHFGGMKGTEPFVGLIDELRAIFKVEDVVDLDLTSATAAYAVLLTRARQEGIDLADMWPAADDFPSFAERRAASLRPLRNAVAETAARRAAEPKA